MTLLVAMRTALLCSEVLGRGGSREHLLIPGCQHFGEGKNVLLAVNKDAVLVTGKRFLLLLLLLLFGDHIHSSMPSHHLITAICAFFLDILCVSLNSLEFKLIFPPKLMLLLLYQSIKPGTQS